MSDSKGLAGVDMQMGSSIALIAGNGNLPLEVARSILLQEMRLLTIAIKGEAVDEMSEIASHWLDWGQIGKMIQLLKENSCRDVILIGGVSKRPNFKSILGDFGTVSRIPKILSILNGGDGNVMQGIIKLFESEGFRIVGAHEFAPTLLAGRGVISRMEPDESAKADIAIAKDAQNVLGGLDIGQAIVVSEGRVIAVEAAEGTDMMLERCAELSKKGRVAVNGRKGVIAKCTKPGQDLRVDLPTIGPNTVRLAAKAGLAGIAVSGETVLIAEREKTVEQADSEGMFISGI